MPKVKKKTDPFGEDRKLTSDKIEKIWSGAGKYAAAFAGARSLYNNIREKKNSKTSYKDTIKLLSKIPSYVQHLRLFRVFRHRPVDLSLGVGQSLQGDLAEMPISDHKNKYILVLVDPFDNFMMTESLPKKTDVAVHRGFEKIFEKYPHPNLSIFGSDDGTEFRGPEMRNFYEKRKIVHHIFRNTNKAFQAERAIRTLKGRLYRSARFAYTKNWDEKLQEMTVSINFTPSRGIGNLAPMWVNDPIFNSLIREKREAVREKEDQYLPKMTKRSFKVGDYVYRDFGVKETPFFKAYDFARGPIFKIKTVDTRQLPHTYTLEDLLGEKEDGFFYSSQLRKAPDPATVSFPVEEVLKEKKEHGINYVFVKWLHYPDTHNSWIRKSALFGGVGKRATGGPKMKNG